MGADEESAVAQLAATGATKWPCIEAGGKNASDTREKLGRSLRQLNLVDSDCVVVVFGSLARDEFTSGSDVDWTLLVDGAANPQHLRSSQEIAGVVKSLGGKPPGPTGVFGSCAFSHDLIHRIGGDADDNKNTTRRILLLVESRAVAGEAAVRERVLRHIIRRYLEEDLPPEPLRARVPRFLLNDIVRYWRTMCVDYAAKRRERAGSGWALRNFKLRMSRKLIFVAGLAMCLRCEFRPPAAAKVAVDAVNVDDYHEALVGSLLESANRSPLESLARFTLDFKCPDKGRKLFDQYEAFLESIDDRTKREELEKLDADQALRNPQFQQARRIGQAFDEALADLFFATDSDLTRLTQRYGVF